MTRPTDSAKAKFTEADMHIAQAGVKLKGVNAPRVSMRRGHLADSICGRGYRS